MSLVVTICTTVGFGDIGATTRVEQFYCIFVMLLGAIVFAKVLGDVQSIMANMSRVSDKQEAVTAQVFASELLTAISCKRVREKLRGAGGAVLCALERDSP